MMCGIDDILPYPELQDCDILNMADAQGLTLLTRDSELYKTAIRRGISSKYVKSLSIKEQLSELSSFISFVSSESRCPMCNGRLVITDREGMGVAPQQLPSQRELWLCKTCGKIYWHGHHWDTMTDIIKSSR